MDQLARTTVFSMPSLHEGLGHTYLEAQAMGVPIVAFDIPVMKEAVVEDRSALLVPIGDVRSLAERIALLFSNRELADRLGSYGYRFVRRNFSVSEQARKLEAIYDEVLAG
jgi:glycosyltransferase involved in cell wall biosynthesis